MTAPASVHPRSVEELLPAARDLTARLGSMPSENQIKTELRIGRPKAKAVREALAVAAPARPALPAVPTAAPAPDPGPADDPTAPVVDPPPAETGGDGETFGHVAVDVDPGTKIAAPVGPVTRRRPVAWPVLLLALPAFVAIWSGWVGLGELAGFGLVRPLPGIWDDLELNTAITLPIGVETYAAYALWVWLSGRAPAPARRFAKWSALGSLVFGAAGQVAYHLLAAAEVTTAPWWITTAVACLPVAVLGMGAALAHLLDTDDGATR